MLWTIIGKRGHPKGVKDDFLPSVAFVDENGHPVDWFYDTFVFYEYALDDPGSTCMYYRVRSQRQPTIDDWKWYADIWFRKNKACDGLEHAAAEVAEKLGSKDKKINVILTLLKPFEDNNAFGPLPGEQEKLDFNREADRQRAIKWYVDYCLKRWQEKKYQRLKLIGFNWSDDAFSRGPLSDQATARWASEYLHSLGLKHYWMPWFNAAGIHEETRGNPPRKYHDWRSTGLDGVVMQTGYYFAEKQRNKLDRLQMASKVTRTAGCGTLIEFDARAISSIEYRERMLANLDAGYYYGWMNDRLMGYLNGLDPIRSFANDKGIGRDLYLKLYEFVKGSYKPSGMFDFSPYPDPETSVIPKPSLLVESCNDKTKSGKTTGLYVCTKCEKIALRSGKCCEKDMELHNVIQFSDTGVIVCNCPPACSCTIGKSKKTVESEFSDKDRRFFCTCLMTAREIGMKSMFCCRKDGFIADKAGKCMVCGEELKGYP